MKTTISISTLICAAMLFMGGCSTTGNLQSYITPANTRVATALVCSNTLTFAVSDADRVQVANYVYSIAQGIRTLAGGKIPTTQELQDTISMFSPGAAKYATLGTAIGAIYGGIFGQLKGNSLLAAQYLEALAGGCEDAAKAFLPPKTP